MGSNVDIIATLLGVSCKEAIQFFNKVDRKLSASVSTYEIVRTLRALPVHKRKFKQVIITLGGDFIDEIDQLGPPTTAKTAKTPSLGKIGLGDDRIVGLRNDQQRKGKKKKSRQARLKTEQRRHCVAELHKWNISYLYHMTSIENVGTILQNGLLSHSEAYRRGLIVNDISMSEIQNRRKYKRDTIYGRFIHDYASLYFSPRNPMLFKRKEIQNRLVILGIDPSVICDEDTIFSDGNVAADSTRFYKGVSQLGQLPWRVINAHYWPDHPDGKRIKCAEVLVYTRVETERIKKIFCYNLKQRDICSKISRGTILIEINTNLYF